MPTATIASNETGEYMQDKFQIRSNLSITAGLRFDYHGGMTEKNGLLYNFDPESCTSYNAATDTIVNNGFIIAGNNTQFPSKGVSDSTLTGRQWGLAPRIGVAWSPKMFNRQDRRSRRLGNVLRPRRAFAYLSPGFAAGVIAGGPFGVNQSPPYVNSQLCTNFTDLYQGFIPTCAPGVSAANPNGGDFENPWGLNARTGSDKQSSTSRPAERGGD